jgi:hypothetical protein
VTKPAGPSERERYDLIEDAGIVALRQPGAVDDPLTGIAREGARRRHASALEAEIEAFLDRHAEERPEDGPRRLVRHGHGPERTIQTGIGALDVRRPKVRDRAAGGGAAIAFVSPPRSCLAGRNARSPDALSRCVDAPFSAGAIFGSS